MDMGPFFEKLAYTNNFTLWASKCITLSEIHNFAQG